MGSKQPDSRALQLLREQLVAAGIRVASQPQAQTLQLAAVAESLGADHTLVSHIFSSHEEYVEFITEHVMSRFRHFVDQPREALSESASFEDQVLTLAKGYFSFAQQDKEAFGAFTSLLSYDEPLSTFDAEVDPTEFHPLLSRLIALVRDEIRKQHGPEDLWLLQTRSYALFAAIHGISHLAAFGLVRFFNSTAQRGLFQTVMRHILAGVTDSLATGRYLVLEPHGYQGNTDFPPILRARDMSRSTNEETLDALFRGAIEQAVTHGLSNLRAEEACARSGIPIETARKLLDPLAEFDQQLKGHLDKWIKGVTLAQFKALGPNSPTLAIAKSTGLAYVAAAMMDPEALEVFVTLSNSSIVPSIHNDDLVSANMGDTFQVLLTMVKAGIVEGGGDATPLRLFENTFNVWAVSHGLANAFSTGPMRNLDKDLKLELLNATIDMSTGSVVTRLGLQLNGAKWASVG